VLFNPFVLYYILSAFLYPYMSSIVSLALNISQKRERANIKHWSLFSSQSMDLNWYLIEQGLMGHQTTFSHYHDITKLCVIQKHKLIILVIVNLINNYDTKSTTKQRCMCFNYKLVLLVEILPCLQSKYPTSSCASHLTSFFCMAIHQWWWDIILN